MAGSKPAVIGSHTAVLDPSQVHLLLGLPCVHQSVGRCRLHLCMSASNIALFE